MEYSEIPLLDFAFAARSPKNAGLNLIRKWRYLFLVEGSDSNMEIYASRSDCGNLFISFGIFANDISRSFFFARFGGEKFRFFNRICPDFI